MKWTEVKINTLSKYEEVVSAILYDMGVSGLVVEDPKDILERSENPGTDYIVLDEFFKDAEKVDKEKIAIKAYFPESEKLGEIISEVKNRITIMPEKENGEPYGEIVLDEVSEEDWANSWKKYYKPSKLCSNIIVKPSWEEYEVKQGEVIIEMDPGMAFGTGTHETTMMCAEMLKKHVECGSTVLDVGCGSGILSIVATKVGSGQVVGVDIDENAIRVSKENAKINGVDHRIEFRQGDLLDVVYEEYHIVVANILAEVIVELTKDIKKCLKSYGKFIASGIIHDKEDMVKQAFEDAGLEVIETIRKGEWTCMVSKMKGN